MVSRPFAQVDVFSTTPLRGNPVAVVLDGAGLRDDEMRAFARWTNLSETTFLLPPRHPDADYLLRIFTPGGELPFAGHPTLGSAHAWLESAGSPRTPGGIVQECGIGLVRLRATGDTIAFAAPPLIREGPADPVDAARAIAVLGVDPRQVVDVQWADNGPGWLAVLLDSAETVLALRPDFVAMGSLKVGAVGPHPAGGGSQWEVRAFVPGIGVPEDPVTGSLNAGLARWFFRDGIADGPYVASQGAALGRRGRITVRPEDGELWVGGASTTVVRGSVEL